MTKSSFSFLFFEKFKFLSFHCTFFVVGQEEGTLEKKNCNGLLDFNGCDIGRQSTYTVSNPINMPPGDGALKEDISGLDAYLISTSSNPEVNLHHYEIYYAP